MQMANRQFFQEKLLAMKSELMNQSGFFRQENPEIRTAKGDEADQAASEINLNLSLRLREREQVLVQKIDHALSKIKEGEFGACEDCGCEIEMKRLIARPYATLCIACKEEHEHQKRFYA